MFENLRDAFSSAAKSLGERELKEKDIEDVLFQLEISLMESDVATEVIDSIKSDLKKKLIGTKVNKKEIEKFVKDSLIQTISSLFDAVGKIDIFSKISSKRDSGQPYIILFVGINGTGKTTTLAKLAYLLKNSKFSVVIAAADTFRAGAIEQLKEHANRLNLKIISQNYGSDPAAVARDAVLYAKSHKIDCVLVDTAGRMQTSKNLMDQIAKITNVVKPDFKIFVGDSLAGNDTVNQAKEFHEHTKFDAAILTKSDADARGGAALSIVKVTLTPILYVGIGQEYEDLKTFDKELFLETVFGKHDKNEISFTTEKVHETESKIDSKQVEESISESQQESESQTIVESSRQSQIAKKYDEIKPSKDSDPFAGLDTKDINLYVDLFDVPPPENDQQAQELSIKIKKWISNGRPKNDNSKEADTQKMKDDSEKTKKKHSLFGRFKK
jgi:fused signal recognition particle receptor